MVVIMAPTTTGTISRPSRPPSNKSRAAALALLPSLGRRIWRPHRAPAAPLSPQRRRWLLASEDSSSGLSGPAPATKTSTFSCYNDDCAGTRSADCHLSGRAPMPATAEQAAPWLRGRRFSSWREEFDRLGYLIFERVLPQDHVGRDTRGADAASGA